MESDSIGGIFDLHLVYLLVGGQCGDHLHWDVIGVAAVVDLVWLDMDQVTG